MAHISFDDVRQMAGPLGLTADDVSRPVRSDVPSDRCNRCGACCKTQNGIILSLVDIHRMAGRLDITPKHFFRRYCRISTDIIDAFGTGPCKGILLATKNRVCPFYKERTGCTINEVKPLTCRLYPFNALNVTRICLMKMQRLKDGPLYKGCYILDLPDNAVVLPDFETMAVSHIQTLVTREFLAQSDDRWQPGLAQAVKDDCIKLSGDKALVGQYARQMRAMFDDLDRRNATLLVEALASPTSP